MTNGPLYAMGGAHPAALATRDAMTGLATGNREGKSAQREQEIYSPWDIMDVCLATWPEGIQLDPCSGPLSLVPSAYAYKGVRIDTGRRTKSTIIEHTDGTIEIVEGEPVWRWGGSGLIAPWADRTYVNPPYEDLEDWLHKSTIEVQHGNTEQILLFPVRPNRTWWCKYMAEVATSVGWLKPLKFVGFASGFPAPLVLVHTGIVVENMPYDQENATSVRFRAAATDLSTFVGGPLC